MSPEKDLLVSITFTRTKCVLIFYLHNEHNYRKITIGTTQTTLLRGWRRFDFHLVNLGNLSMDWQHLGSPVDILLITLIVFYGLI